MDVVRSRPSQHPMANMTMANVTNAEPFVTLALNQMCMFLQARRLPMNNKAAPLCVLICRNALDLQTASGKNEMKINDQNPTTSSMTLVL